MPNHDRRPGFQLSLRDLIILVISIGAGAAAWQLLRSSGTAPGPAVIGAVTAFGATFYFFDRIIT